jgi:hypothetical protein
MGVGLYAHTLGQPFVFDDIVYIQENPLVWGNQIFRNLFNQRTFAQLDEIYGILPDITTNMMIRPVAYLTFSLNYYFDGVNPDGYRAVNILLHSFNAVLVFLLLSKLLRMSRQPVALDVFSLRFIPAVAAVLFLLHPIQSESVLYAIQRITVLASLFMLLTLHTFLCSADTENRKMKVTLRAASVFFLLAGMLTKEILFVVPVLIVLMETAVLRTSLISSIRRAGWHLLLMPVVPLLVMASSAAQSGSRLSVMSIFSVNNLKRYSPVEYAFTQFEVIISYIRLLLVPVYQNVDHDFHLHTSILNLHVLLSAGAVLALCASAVVLFRNYRGGARTHLMSFGIAWFFIALSLTSSIVPLPDLMAEHRVYEASIGLFLGIACAADMLRERYTTSFCRKCLVSSAVVLCLVLGGVTYARTLVWRSGFSLWQDSLKKSPENERAWHALGLEYLERKDYIKAEIFLKKAISLDPAYLKPYLTLGVVYSQQVMHNEEIDVYRLGLAQNPSSPELLENLGTAYAQNGQLAESVSVFEEALKVNPLSDYSRKTLSTVQQIQHESEAASGLHAVKGKGGPST